MVKVHYFFDPLCGWCYGASPLIKVLVNTAGFEVVYHPGGMIPRLPIEPAFRQHILQADERIAEQTKVQFGQAYKDRVLSKEELILDSYLTTRAFLVGIEMGVTAYQMLKSIQEAHYVHGAKLDEKESLKNIALSLGLDGNEWDDRMELSESNLYSELEASHTLMKELEVSGFPSVIAELDSGLTRLPLSAYYDNASGWSTYLSTLS